MHSDISQFLYKAEDAYLENQDVALYRYNVATMSHCLKGYKTMRDQEIHVFQLIADELEDTYPSETRETLEEAIKQWVLLSRYCAMAMLLNNSDYLEQRLNNWFKDLIQFRTVAEIDQTIYEFLLENLEDVMTEQQYDLLMPYLTQVKQSLLDAPALPELAQVN